MKHKKVQNISPPKSLNCAFFFEEISSKAFDIRNKLLFILFYLAFSLSAFSVPIELVTNGNFSGSGLENGYSTEYNYDSDVSSNRSYNIGSNPSSLNGSLYSFFDHTSGNSSGKMLVANASTGSGDDVWDNQISVISGMTYTLTFWYRNAYSVGTPTLSWRIGGSYVGGTVTTSTSWQQHTITYTATSTGNINFVIREMTNNSSGNVFAIDDVSITFDAINTPSSNVCVQIELNSDGEFNSGSENSSYTSDLPTSYGNGMHQVDDNPQDVWGWAPIFSDHTGNGGNMLLADGANYANYRVWYNTYYIESGTTLTLSVWIRDFWGGTDAARLYWGINGVQVGSVVTAQSGVWTQLTTTYTATTNGNIVFGVHNQQNSSSGNDFAIDDVSIIKCVQPTCSGNFYDTGGSGSNYSNNEDYSRTYCSSYGQRLIMTFNSFSTNSSSDRLYIYDGGSTLSTQIGNYSGSSSPGTVYSTDNCLTFRFSSNGSGTSSGWNASIACFDDANCDDIDKLVINNLGAGADIDISSGATLYTNQLPASWNLETTVIGSQNISIGFDISGSYTDIYTENTAVYHYRGDNNPVTWGAGTYNITNTLYQSDNRGGKICGRLNSVLTIENCNLSGFSPTSNSPACTESSILLDAGTVSGGGATYAWTGPNGFTSSAEEPTIASATTSHTGIYSVTITMTGCSASATTQVNVIQSPVVNVSMVQANCGLNNGVLDFSFSDNVSQTSLEFSTNGGTTYPYSVNDNAGTYAISSLAPATYDVRVRWGTGQCVTNLSAWQIIRQSGTATISGTSPICIGQSSTLTASLTNAVGGVTYSWTGGLGTGNPKIVSPTTNSNYTVTATDSQGCTGTASIAVVVNSLPAATASSNSPVCDGGTLNLSGNAGMSSYSWAGPQGSYSGQNPSVSGVNPSYSGTYILTVQNANGCQNTASTSVTVATFMTPTASNSGPYCVGQDITLTATGGNTYLWSGPLSYSNTGTPATRLNATLGMGGVYTVTATITATGCSATATTSVSVLSTAISASNNGPLCVGENLTLTSSGGNGSFSWTGPNSYSASGTPVSIANITTGNEGVYTVTSYVTPSCPVTATTDLTIYALPNISVTDTVKVCTGDNATLTASGGTNYTWIGPNGFNQSNTSGTVTVTGVNISKTGVYSVTVTNASGCTASATTYLTISIANLSASSNSPVCQGTNIYLNASGVVNYSWTGPNGFSSTAASDTISSAAAVHQGVYVLTASNALGCTATAAVTVNVLLNSPTITGTSSLCVGDSIQLSLPNWPTHSWTGPLGFSSSLANPTIANASTSNGGIYSVTVSHTGCTATATFNVTVNALPNISISGSPIVCRYATISLTASGGTSYSWIGPNAYSNSSSLVSIPNANTINSGDYILVGTDANSCVNSDTLNVGISYPIVTAGGGGTVCDGGSISLNSGGGISYSWVGPASFSSSSANGTLLNVNPTNSGIYSITVTNSDGCTASASVSAIVSKPTVSMSSNSPICVGQSIVLNGGGGASYTWTGPQSFLSGVQNPVISNATSLKMGYYALQITDSVGCQVIDSIYVTVNDLPTATASNGGPVCVGTSLQLNASGGTIYYWTGPSGFASSSQNPILSNVTSADSGVYSVTVTDANSCSSTATTSVTINSLPIPTATVVNPNICITQTIQLNSSGGVSYSWGGPSSGSAGTQAYNRTNATVAMSGIYTVTVTDANGCTASASVTANVHPLPNPPTVSDVSICGAGSASITASGCAGTYNWYPSNSSSTNLGSNATYVTPSLSVGTVEDYFVNCTVYTCPSSSRSVSVVTVLQPPTSVVASNTGEHCVYTTAKLFGSASNATSYMWAGPGGFTSNVQSPTFVTQSNSGGIYTLTAIASNGCTATATTNLVVNTNCGGMCSTYVAVEPTNPSSCSNTNGSIRAQDYNAGVYEISLDGITWKRSTHSSSNGTVSNLGVGDHLVFLRDYTSKIICRTVIIKLISNGGSFFTGYSTTSATGCFQSDGSILLNGVQGTDEVSWLGYQDRTYVPVSSLSPSNRISNLLPGTYYVRVKRDASVYCYKEQIITVLNSGTACDDNIFCELGPEGNKFINGDFGSGTSIQGPPLAAGATEYGYVNMTCTSPNDGFYTVVNALDCNGSSSGGAIFGTWDILSTDHTPGDTGGYMMVVNAAYEPNIVVQQTIGDLCPNSRYNFTAWVLNLTWNDANHIEPNFAFLIDGVSRYTTGDITSSGWQQVGFSFETGNVDEAIFSIRNNATGGMGNDWVIDDIVVSKCPLVIDMEGVSIACLGSETEEITATVEDVLEEYTFYKWQEREDSLSAWTDASGVLEGTYTNNVMSVGITLPNPIPSSLSGVEYRIVFSTDSSGFENPGCTFSSQLTQILVPPMQLVITNDTAKCLGTGNLTLAATITGGDAPYSYQWANGLGTNPSIQVNPSVTTDYIVTAWDVNNCPATDTITVQVSTQPTLTVTIDEDSVCLDGVAEIVAQISGGSGVFDFTWFSTTDTNGTWTEITGEKDSIYSPITNPVGLTYYRVFVEDLVFDCNDALSNSVLFTVFDDAQASVSLTDTTFCIDGLVTLSANLTGGTGSLTYQWQQSPNGINSWTDLSGETNPYLDIPVANSGVNFYRYSVSSDASGCNIPVSDSARVEILPPFGVDLTLDNGIICIGGSVILTADTINGIGNVSYQWFSSPDGSSFSVIPGETTLTYSPSTSSIGSMYYQVAASSAGPGCGTATSDSAEVEVLPVFSVDVNIDNEIVCIGGNVELLADTINGTGIVTYQWLSSIDGISFTPITDSTNISLHPSTSSEGISYYKVEATASGSGCGTVVSDSVVVEVLPVFSVAIDLLGNPICIGGNVLLTADTTNGTGTVTYQWYESSDNVVFSAIADSTGITLQPNTGTEGLYYYLVEATASGPGCGTVVSDTVQVEILPVFSVDLLIDNALVCQDGSVVLTADTVNGTGTITYQWYNSLDGSNFNPIASETALTYTAPTNAPGIIYYQVAATASGSGCGTVTSAFGTVEVLPQMSIGINPFSAEVCLGEAVNLNANTQNGVGTFTYQWQESSNNTLWSDIVSETDTFFIPNTSASGIKYYRIIGTPSGVGCANDTAASVIVTVYEFPDVVVSSVDPLCIPNNGEITLTFADEPNQTNIEFSLDGGATYIYNVLDVSGSFTVDTLYSGTYSIFARWSDTSCPIDLGNVTLSERPSPNASITTTDPSCTIDNGEITFAFADESTRTQIEFSLDGGLNYEPAVLDNSGSVTYPDLAPGTYDLWVRWENDECPVDLPDVTLSNHPGPVITVSADTTICFGSNALISVSSTGGDAPVSYTWNNGLPNGNSNTVSPTSGTYYVVVATDLNGCTAEDSILVSVNALPTVSVTGGEYCEGDTAFLSSGGGVSYQWSGPNSFSSTAQNPVVTGVNMLDNGYFHVLVTDINFCQNLDSAEVIVNAAPDAPILANGFNCGPGVLTLTASGCSGVITWYDNQFSNSVVGLGTTFETTSLVATKNYFASCTSSSSCVSFDRTKVVAEIREASNAEVIPVNSTCVGEVALNNGILIVTGFRDGEMYSFSEGNTFNPATAIPSSPEVIPTNGRIFGDIDNPIGPTSYYTVRIISTEGCPLDQTVEFQRQCEDCLPFCEPAKIEKVK